MNTYKRESLLLTNSFISDVGLGVVVIITCGLVPNLKPNINWSHASGFFQLPNSSHHALWNCGPLNLSGCSDEKVL